VEEAKDYAGLWSQGKKKEEEHKLRSSSLYDFLHSSVTSS